MRIDKFLWCVRLCKTRSLAAEECKRGHVRLNDKEAKASAEVKENDVVSVRQAPIWRVLHVKAIPTSRVGAKLLPELIEDKTPWEDLEKQEIARKVRVASRDPGTGRPTKRDRRDMERYGGGE
ncbi:MAG: RNA-binding S4 domain-containing protein [Flavobacteriales bacterium]|nr:RNA-binding S4 domain-containing protein [Flavobacteriales bacterium]MBK7285979.1 RNA-binding S4 domain-containing protein [Flavobacteriales bacterium]MBK9597464.1 RNA-binding S4 domain-containing protein [Flavobacteriales bacterium]